jgi:hypothetical protein
MAWIRHGLTAVSALLVISFAVVPAASAATETAPAAGAPAPGRGRHPPGSVRGRVLHSAEPAALGQPGRHHLGPPRDVTRVR